MNRIILIGNGFDLAHGLPTRYEDFINWYWEQRLLRFAMNNSRIDASDILCTFEITSVNRSMVWCDVFNQWRFRYKGKQGGQFMKEAIIDDKENFHITYSDFFGVICKSIEAKGWVDIENEYYGLLRSCTSDVTNDSIYALNEQFKLLRGLLLEYLSSLKIDEYQINDKTKSLMYSSFRLRDIAVSKREEIAEYFKYWISLEEWELEERLFRYGVLEHSDIKRLIRFKELHMSKSDDVKTTLENLMEYEFTCKDIGLRPDRMLFLDFNYTKNLKRYCSECLEFEYNAIHGTLEDFDSVIFGHGDDLDDGYNEIEKLNENEYFRNMKIFKYLEASNYRDMLAFVESSPYQIFIMGHSCGISDRTLLNTLFEHRNCVSIKPFYFQKEDGTDNYLDIVQNISRIFTDMKAMRDIVVNKKFCEPLPQKV